MFTGRLAYVAIAGLALTFGACTQATEKLPDDGGSGTGGNTGGGGLSGGGGLAGTGGLSGTGGLQPPRLETWADTSHWVGTWPATTDGTTASKFAGKTVDLLITTRGAEFCCTQMGWSYHGSITFDTVGPLTLQAVGSSSSATASYVWWLYDASYEQVRLQGYQDANNRISLSTASLGAKGTLPATLKFDTWSISVGGVTESSGSNPGASLIVLTRQ